MKIIKLSKTRKIPFEIKSEGITGTITATIPKAPEVVSLWNEYNNIEGSDKEKGIKQTKLVIDTFIPCIQKATVFDIKTGEAVEFTDDEDKPISDLTDIFKEYFSLTLFYCAMELFSLAGGKSKDPLEVSSSGS
jgi:hypothetical protein